MCVAGVRMINLLFRFIKCPKIRWQPWGLTTFLWNRVSRKLLRAWRRRDLSLLRASTHNNNGAKLLVIKLRGETVLCLSPFLLMLNFDFYKDPTLFHYYVFGCLERCLLMCIWYVCNLFQLLNHCVHFDLDKFSLRVSAFLYSWKSLFSSLLKTKKYPSFVIKEWINITLLILWINPSLE